MVSNLMSKNMKIYKHLNFNDLSLGQVPLHLSTYPGLSFAELMPVGVASVSASSIACD